jgi:hypothetical protein
MRHWTMVFMGWMVICVGGCSESPQGPDQSPALESGITTMDTTRDGTYTADAWQYVFAITGKGSRSQGTLGQLSYAGQVVPIPEDPDDYYDTPLGRFVYNGMPPGTETHPVMPWHDKGWMLMKQNAVEPSGQAMPLPGTEAAVVLQTRKFMLGVVLELASAGLGPEEYPLEAQSQDKSDIGKDPWGTLYKIYPDMRGGEGGGETLRWVIQSAGPDKRFGSNDDLERHSAFVTTGSSDLDVTEMDMLEGAMEMEPEAVD